MRFPRTILSSIRKNSPPVSAAVAFHVNTPPPANHICSPSPSCRMMGTAVLMRLLAGAGVPRCHDVDVRQDLHGQYGTVMGMSIPYELTGRVRQKARTRTAMVAATRAALAEGVTPTVEQAAERAGISRTTAYRYFPNQRALLIASYPELDAPSLLDAPAPLDAVARLELVTESIARQVLEHEAELRTMLRLSLESPKPEPDALPLRRGRAIGWIEDALAPLRDRFDRASDPPARPRHPRDARHRGVRLADRHRRPPPRGCRRPDALLRTRHPASCPRRRRGRQCEPAD